MCKIQSMVFLSNCFNHHQKNICDELAARGGFVFIEITKIPQSRRTLGWDNVWPSYVVSRSELDANRSYYQNMIDQADVVIIGAAPISMVKERIRNNKLTFLYSERLLKKGMELWKYPYRLIRGHNRYPVRKNVHLLCASAYAAQDYAMFFLFRKKCYKWGYFPPVYKYNDVSKLIEQKKPHSLVWAGRFIAWKHPELVVEIGRRLKQDGIAFEIDMIGTGEEMDEVVRRIKRYGLENEIHLLGRVSPEVVREHMEKAEIHLFTSNRKEGWGAVLNEAMNGACVPVACREAGSVPYLVNESNGFVYTSEDELYKRVKWLLENDEKRKQMAYAAYATIVDEWNAENASERLVALAEYLLSEGKTGYIAESGVCSRA